MLMTEKPIPCISSYILRDILRGMVAADAAQCFVVHGLRVERHAVYAVSAQHAAIVVSVSGRPASTVNSRAPGKHSSAVPITRSS